MNPSQSAFLERIHQYEKAGWISKHQVDEFTRRVEREGVEELSQELGALLRKATSVQGTTTTKTKTKLWDPLEWGATMDQDAKAIDDLFAEMCLFARLGFFQAPCCLHCAYLKQVDDQCQRWVVWRKDANQLLHPDSIGKNITILPCCAAGRLLNEEVVDGWKWDKEEKVLRQA